MADLLVRAAGSDDTEAIWRIMAPIVQAGETYPLPRDLSRDQAIGWWFAPGHRVFVATRQDIVAGTYYLRANQQGGGAHVANCGYMTAGWAVGRGVARAMCAHSLEEARDVGFAAMQYNFVVSSNFRAIRLWQSFGFEIVGRSPRAFRHPALGEIDALIMHRLL